MQVEKIAAKRTESMPEEDPTLQFELNEEAIGLMLKSVSFYLERYLARRA